MRLRALPPDMGGGRIVPVLLGTLLLPGCLGGGFGGHGCEGSSLHATWDEPGLHERIAAASPGPGVVRSEVPAPSPAVRDDSFAARWGEVGLVELRLGEGRRTHASITRETWAGDGPLQLSISVLNPGTLEDGLARADELLATLGVDESERAAYREALREAWTPYPHPVANSVSAVPFTSDVAWDDMPARIFPDGLPEPRRHAAMRSFTEGAWWLTLQVPRLRVAGEDGRVQLEVAKDDHVVAFVQMRAGEDLPSAFARVNATLDAAGGPPATFQGYDGAQAVC